MGHKFKQVFQKVALCQEKTVSKDRNTELKHPLPSPASITLGKKACHSPPTKLTRAKFPQVEDQKRSRVPKDPPSPAPGKPLRKTTADVSCRRCC